MSKWLHTALANLAVHELGHQMGLGHTRPNDMKCPTCGKADLIKRRGIREFRGYFFLVDYKECLKCGERIYHAKVVRAMSNETSIPDSHRQG